MAAPARTRSPHPIAERALELLERGTDEPVLLTPRALRLLEDALLALFRSAELKPAVLALVELAFVLESERSPKAARALLAIAATATEALREQAPPARIEAMRNRARSFFGTRGPQLEAPNQRGAKPRRLLAPEPRRV